MSNPQHQAIIQALTTARDGEQLLDEIGPEPRQWLEGAISHLIMSLADMGHRHPKREGFLQALAPTMIHLGPQLKAHEAMRIHMMLLDTKRDAVENAPDAQLLGLMARMGHPVGNTLPTRRQFSIALAAGHKDILQAASPMTFTGPEGKIAIDILLQEVLRSYQIGRLISLPVLEATHRSGLLPADGTLQASACRACAERTQDFPTWEHMAQGGNFLPALQWMVEHEWITPEGITKALQALLPKHRQPMVENGLVATAAQFHATFLTNKLEQQTAMATGRERGPRL